MALQLLYGFLFAALIAFAAYRARNLSISGAWGALLEGTIIFGLGGWKWAVLLLTFFISSSIFTKLFSKKKNNLNEKFDKGGTRDIGQVLANGAIASIFAGLSFFIPSAPWTWVAFVSSLAAVNADTWATELGVLDPTQPRLITTWKKVERGSSGAISLFGTLAASGGAALLAILGAILGPTSQIWSNFAAILFAGLIGSFFDSLLGATVQAIYRCPNCGKETEKHPFHTCGTETVLVRGWSWLNNDMVNLGCALMGALLGLAV